MKELQRYFCLPADVTCTAHKVLRDLKAPQEPSDPKSGIKALADCKVLLDLKDLRVSQAPTLVSKALLPPYKARLDLKVLRA